MQWQVNLAEVIKGKSWQNSFRRHSAVKRAVKEAILKHKQAGNPIVGMKNGQMVWFKPEEIQA